MTCLIILVISHSLINFMSETVCGLHLHFIAQVIPCYTRNYFLQKYAIPTFQNTSFDASFRTVHGFQIPVKVINERGITFITGNGWTEFARLYRLHTGSEIIIEIDTHGPISTVITGTQPITHQIGRAHV